MPVYRVPKWTPGYCRGHDQGEALLLKTTKDGVSCLVIACHNGHLEIAKALVKASRDSRAAFLLMTDSVRGDSCLHVACHHGHLTAVDFLLSLPCAGLIGLQDRSGRTALEHAVASGQADADAAAAIRAAGRPQRPV